MTIATGQAECITWDCFDRTILKPYAVLKANDNVDRSTLAHYLTTMCQSAGLRRIVIDSFLSQEYYSTRHGRSIRLSREMIDQMYRFLQYKCPSKVFAMVLRQHGYELGETA